MACTTGEDLKPTQPPQLTAGPNYLRQLRLQMLHQLGRAQDLAALLPGHNDVAHFGALNAGSQAGAQEVAVAGWVKHLGAPAGGEGNLAGIGST